MWLDKFKTAIEDESNIMWFVCKNQTHETELNMMRNAKNLFHNWAIGKERKSSIYQKDIVSFVKSEGGMEYAKMRLHEFVDNAKIALRPLGDVREVGMLSDIAEYTAVRKS